MRFLYRASSLDFGARDATNAPSPSPARVFPAPPDFGPATPRARATTSHTHKRTPSLVSKFTRAFSLNRRGSMVTIADISAPIAASPQTPRCDGEYVEVEPTPRQSTADDEWDRYTMCYPLHDCLHRHAERQSALPPRDEDRHALWRRRGIIFENTFQPPSPSPPKTNPFAQNHARHLSLPPHALQAQGRQRLPPSPLRTTHEEPDVSPESASDAARFRIRRKPPPPLPDLGQPSISDQATEYTPRRDSLTLDDDVSAPFIDLDALFAELLEECTPTPTPTKPRKIHNHAKTPANLHQRSQSTPTDLSHLASPSLKRHGALRTSRPTRALTPSRSQPLVDGERRFRHKAPELNPFFPSGRSFEPIRARKPAPQPTTPGRVKSAVREIERISSTADTATPIRDLGSILERPGRVDSNELTLESKRIMELARQRRSVR